MKVILLENIKNVGKKDEVINASDGYARNYLFPKKLAVEANTENMSKLKSRENADKYRKDQERKQAEEIAKKMQGIMLKVKVKAGENGKIFGGVTSKEISDELKKQYQIEVDKKKILLSENIKNLGMFVVDIKLYEGVLGKLKVDVISKD
ncbi:MAG: 50S ribosomal protein L9 [Clostridia bacterium]